MNNVESIINSITYDSILIMTVWGETHTYAFEADYGLGLSLKCLDDEEHPEAYYDTAMGDLDEVKATLIKDYEDGIITYIAIKEGV